VRQPSEEVLVLHAWLQATTREESGFWSQGRLRPFKQSVARALCAGGRRGAGSPHGEQHLAETCCC